jgi:hypothetical protein
MDIEKQKQKREARNTIMQLSEMCDLIALRVQIMDKSKYGKRPHKSDPWGYTRAFLAYYAPETDAERVLGLLQAGGCNNDVEAARWLLRYDELVP